MSILIIEDYNGELVEVTPTLYGYYQANRIGHEEPGCCFGSDETVQGAVNELISREEENDLEFIDNEYRNI